MQTGTLYKITATVVVAMTLGACVAPPPKYEPADEAVPPVAQVAPAPAPVQPAVAPAAPAEAPATIPAPNPFNGGGGTGGGFGGGGGGGWS